MWFVFLFLFKLLYSLFFWNCCFLAFVFPLPLFCYLYRWWCKENWMKPLAIEEPSSAWYLSTEENRNAVSTEMMLAIIGSHLKTFPVHFSLLWLHLYCGLDMPRKDIMITLCCIQGALSCPQLFGSCLLFLLDIRFPSLLFQHGCDASSMTESQTKSNSWPPTWVLLMGVWSVGRKIPVKNPDCFLESAHTPNVNLEAGNSSVK